MNFFTLSLAPRDLAYPGIDGEGQKMGLYEWRFRISLAAAQQFSSPPPSRQAVVSRSTRSPPEATALPWLIRLWRIPGQSTPSFGRAASERAAPETGDRPRRAE